MIRRRFWLRRRPKPHRRAALGGRPHGTSGYRSQESSGWFPQPFSTNCNRGNDFDSCALLLSAFPRRIWIVQRHAFRDGRRVLAEIFFVDDAGVTADEGHHTGSPPAGRIGDQREAADHLAINQVIVCTTFGMLALRGQNSIVVTVMMGLRRGPGSLAARPASTAGRVGSWARRLQRPSTGRPACRAC